MATYVSLPDAKQRVNVDRITGTTRETNGTVTYTFDNIATHNINVSASDSALIETALARSPSVVTPSAAAPQQGYDYATTYGGTDSFQVLAADLTLEAAAGKSDAGNTAFLAPIMGNISGANLTKTHNYISGTIGATGITGTKSTVLFHSALAGVLFDGVTDADAIVLAHIDGNDPSSQTNANAAFGVSQANTHAGSGVNYGVSLKFSPSAGLNTLLSSAAKAFKVIKALFQSPNDVCWLEGSGVPVDGTTGLNFAGKGSEYTDYTNGEKYINTGTSAATVWKKYTHA